MAPRPVTGKTQKPPWYKTTAGQTIAAIGTLLLLLFIAIWVNNARTASREREQTQESLESYTDQVRAILQDVTGPASEMAAATQAPPEDLRATARGWSEALVGAQTQAAQLIAPEDAGPSTELFAQSINLFRSAAETFVTAAGLEGQQQTNLLGAAGAQVASASQVWDAGVGLLDTAREDNEMRPSGLRSPTAAPPTGMEQPEAEATIPIETDDAGGDAGGGDGGGGAGGGDGGGSNQDDGSGG